MCLVCHRERPLYVVWTTDEAIHAHLCASCLAAAAAREVGGELPALASVVRVLTDENYGLTDGERADLRDVALAGVAQARQQLADAQAERDEARRWARKLAWEDWDPYKRRQRETEPDWLAAP